MEIRKIDSAYDKLKILIDDEESGISRMIKNIAWEGYYNGNESINYFFCEFDGFIIDFYQNESQYGGSTEIHVTVRQINSVANNSSEAKIQSEKVFEELKNAYLAFELTGAKVEYIPTLYDALNDMCNALEDAETSILKFHHVPQTGSIGHNTKRIREILSGLMRRLPEVQIYEGENNVLYIKDFIKLFVRENTVNHRNDLLTAINIINDQYERDKIIRSMLSIEEILKQFPS